MNIFYKSYSISTGEIISHINSMLTECGELCEPQYDTTQKDSDKIAHKSRKIDQKIVTVCNQM